MTLIALKYQGLQKTRLEERAHKEDPEEWLCPG